MFSIHLSRLMALGAFSVVVLAACPNDPAATGPTSDVVADSVAPDAVTSDAVAPDAVVDTPVAGDAALDVTGVVDFEVLVSASPEIGPVPLNVTLVATVTGDIGISDVTLQWYRGDVKLEAKNDAAWIIILVETTTMRVEATYAGANGPITKQASVTVEVVAP